MKIEGACHPVISVCPFKAESSIHTFEVVTINFMALESRKMVCKKMRVQD